MAHNLYITEDDSRLTSVWHHSRNKKVRLLTLASICKQNAYKFQNPYFTMKRGKMAYQTNKKGLSTVVTTLIVILLVLVAIAVIWVVIRGVIERGTEQIGIGRFTIDMEIKSATYGDTPRTGTTTETINVAVTRNPGKGDLTGINFILEDSAGQIETIKKDETNYASNFPFNELQTKTFTLKPTIILPTEITKVSIAPIIKTESGKAQDLEVMSKSNVKPIIDTELPLIYEASLALVHVDDNGIETEFLSNPLPSQTLNKVGRYYLKIKFSDNVGLYWYYIGINKPIGTPLKNCDSLAKGISLSNPHLTYESPTKNDDCFFDVIEGYSGQIGYAINIYDTSNYIRGGSRTFTHNIMVPG